MPWWAWMLAGVGVRGLCGCRHRDRLLLVRPPVCERHELVNPLVTVSTWGMKYWPWFLLVTTAQILFGFGVPETIALVQGAHKPSSGVDNTLSHYARYELNVSAHMTIHTVTWWFTLVVFLAFVVFAVSHIWFDQIW